MWDGAKKWHLAAAYGNYEIVKILVSACANVNNTTINSAVEEASEAGIEKIVRIKRLMCEVQTQVERDPSNYYSFVKLVEDLPEVKNLLEQLQGVYTVYSPCVCV